MTDRTRAAVEGAREAVLAGAGASGVRRDVLDSWSRCRGYGVDPDTVGPPVDLAGDRLADYRAAHPLTAALPVIRSLLVEHAVDDNLVVAVTDTDGLLLYVEGNRGMRARAESIGFTAGARWDERHAGTNAPALALALNRSTHITSAEHWARPVQRWSCSAAPVHDPVDGRQLGALDVTGDDHAAAPGILALVTATVAAVERELLVRHLGLVLPPQADTGPRVRLSVLGAGAPTLYVDGRTSRVGPRHAEILLLLADRPEGLSGRQLAELLDERTLDAVTVRAEMSRLRHAVGASTLRSGPYRLDETIGTDVADVRRLLAVGDLDGVVRRWQGVLLPRSCAPGIAALRARLEEEVRVAVLRRGDPELLLRWADGPVARDDLELWRRCRDLQPAGPARDRATARVRLLDREFGLPGG